jgi:hypothetical protein
LPYLQGTHIQLLGPGTPPRGTLSQGVFPPQVEILDKILLTKPGLLYQETFSAKKEKNTVTLSHPSLLVVAIK